MLLVRLSSLAAAFSPPHTSVPLTRPVQRRCWPTGFTCVEGASRAAGSWHSVAEKNGVNFVGSFQSPKDMQTFVNIPEFCLAGRSNVGKSSALNCLSCRKKAAAVVSKTPGRTRLLNLFKVGKACTIVDLPGYGFAKVSKEMQDSWKSQVTAYLRRREQLKLAVVLVDAQRDPQEQDAQLLDFLEAEDIPTLVVATKTDKLGKNKLEQSLARLHESLALPEGQPIPLSSKTAEGRREVWWAITQLCGKRPEKEAD